jgi:asparagine synthase (glutamine-hydrolysing)
MQTLIPLVRRLRTALDRLETPAVVREVTARKLTYLDHSALRWLAEQVATVERERVPGVMLETGCALGGSSIVIAATKAPARRLELYDVFGQIPPPSEKDGKDVHARYETIRSGKSAGIDGDTYYGYEPDLLAKVAQNFRAFGLAPEANDVHFVAGLYGDTLRPSGPVAFAHIDCDWYDSVMVCLERIVPQLSASGRIVVDDYFFYSGCRAAVWDYFRPRIDSYRFTYGPRLLITPVAEHRG